MRKFCFSFLVASIILLMVGISFAADVPRYGTSSLGKTSYGNVAVRGLDRDATGETAGSVATGCPGYIEITSTRGDVYYIFVDSRGLLRIASDTSVGYLASPATVGWSDASGEVVGRQNGSLPASAF